MNEPDLDSAKCELSSLLHKCETALANGSFSKGRATLLKNRIAALKVALQLVTEKQEGQ